jgi:hypothetical protein
MSLWVKLGYPKIAWATSKHVQTMLTPAFDLLFHPHLRERLSTNGFVSRSRIPSNPIPAMTNSLLKATPGRPRIIYIAFGTLATMYLLYIFVT